MLEQILAIMMVLLPIISYLPQIIKTLLTKESEDISIFSWILYCLSYVIECAYVVLRHETWLIASYFIEFSLCLITLILAIRYKDKKKKRERDKNEGGYNGEH